MPGAYSSCPLEAQTGEKQGTEELCISIVALKRFHWYKNILGLKDYFSGSLTNSVHSSKPGQIQRLQTGQIQRQRWAATQ